jgi:phosphatidylglycerol lysyltransferase
LGAGQQWALDHLARYGRNPFSTCLLYSGVERLRCQATDGFVGYLDSRWVQVAMGEPVCPTDDYRAAATEFIRPAGSRRKACVFVAVGEQFRRATRDLGFTSLRVGDDLIFDVATYAPRGDHAKKVRSAANQLRKRGGIVRQFEWPDGPEPGTAGRIDSMVQRWLRARSKLQAHFLDLDLYKFAELKRYFCVQFEDRIVALLSCLPIFARGGYLFEDLIRDPEALNGASELMVLEALRVFREEGTAMATFGLSPRIDAEGAENLSRVNALLVGIGVRLATRLGKLNNLYHYRKKFHTGIAEPSYLLKYPAASAPGTCWGS